MKVKVSRRFTKFDNWTVWELRFNFYGCTTTTTIGSQSKDWNRQTAKAALDLLGIEWPELKRQNIRFEVK
jgi:hypothetical protein